MCPGITIVVDMPVDDDQITERVQICVQKLRPPADEVQPRPFQAISVCRIDKEPG